ncbi:MAG: exodeoxyribonuclease VII large subunit [Bacteroidales bacterium]|nr:exodeoxyribonuclease VII large subunit [Bacteroidales bacterium]MCM1146335.1 exodeoxyribonuclease VII large subunit [Bacteroidales bacterium]MCM1205227.1 exodeoxyribonuclease VII large subunit [Bacillota bacterium]MCM1509688.1 exodeoxyribonuclease VII large subunit [Clostridium sp.]
MGNQTKKRKKNVEHLSLYELNSLVGQAIEAAMPMQYWVEAELAEANERRGHLYLDLVQKDGHGNTPVARASAKCWASAWMPLKIHFERITGQCLAAGMKVLLRVYPQFHPAYGFSWIVTDIDPTYTVGDMVRRRQEIVRSLKEAGIFGLQKELRLPMLCRRIAVISSETAAGYGDFCSHLADNEYGFAFMTRLFPAIMQGERVEQSVIAALDRIYAVQEEFDCVVMIRGGGATSDMSGFDTLALAENVANFPLPIITGIGHDRDECVLDMVSHVSVKTPTAAAAFLIDHLAAVSERVAELAERVAQAVRHRLEIERMRLATLTVQLPMVARQGIQQRRHHVDLLSHRVAALDPELVLARGYSMTLCNGKIVTDVGTLGDGDMLETRFAKGKIKSKVWKKK